MRVPAPEPRPLRSSEGVVDALASDDGQSSQLPRALCPLAATSERPHPQGQLAPVELAGDSDFLAPFWRIGVIEMAC
jgi:hypothetical protein